MLFLELVLDLGYLDGIWVYLRFFVRCSRKISGLHLEVLWGHY